MGLSTFFTLLLVSLALSCDQTCLWAKFKSEYQKTYATPTEEEYRFTIFTETLKKINELNKAMPSATFGINFFSDLTPQEFATKYLQLNATFQGADQLGEFFDVEQQQEEGAEIQERQAPALPTEYTSPYITPVKTQGDTCLAGWAFAATGVVESAVYKVTGTMYSLSEQQLIDCDTRSRGCDAGNLDTSLQMILANSALGGGQMTEAAYPYTGVKDTCKYNQAQGIAKIMKVMAMRFDEARLDSQLYLYSPIAVGIDATLLQSYVSGILLDSYFCHRGVNHAVILAGWGDTPSPYWVMKNSFGPSWGESGYFKLQRGVGACFMSKSIIVAAFGTTCASRYSKAMCAKVPYCTWCGRKCVDTATPPAYSCPACSTYSTQWTCNGAIGCQWRIRARLCANRPIAPFRP
jgi:cathepsin F